MAFSASSISALNRAWSIGPVKIEIQSFSMLSDDTSGSVTANHLSTVYAAILPGAVNQDVAPVISGNSVTLSFADIDIASPEHASTDCTGYVILIGV